MLEDPLDHAHYGRGVVREILCRDPKDTVGDHFGGVAQAHILGIQAIRGGHSLLFLDKIHQFFTHALGHRVRGLDLLNEFKKLIRRVGLSHSHTQWLHAQHIN